MPCWFLNHCKGRKCYCLTTCLAMQQLIWWIFAQNMTTPRILATRQHACDTDTHSTRETNEDCTWESSEHKKTAIMKNAIIQKQNFPLSLKKFRDVLEPNTGKHRITSPQLTFSQ
jgi:hypothetical protein